MQNVKRHYNDTLSPVERVRVETMTPQRPERAAGGGSALGVAWGRQSVPIGSRALFLMLHLYTHIALFLDNRLLCGRLEQAKRR